MAAMRALTAIAAFVFVVAALPSVHAQSYILTSDTLSNLVVTRKAQVYVAPLCAGIYGSTAAATGPTYACTTYWTVLIDKVTAAGSSDIKFTLYDAKSVQLVKGEEGKATAVWAPKPGASPFDEWVTSWSADWTSGKGRPADKTYRKAGDAGTFTELPVPFFLFAKIDGGSSDVDVPVTIWAGSVAQNAAKLDSSAASISLAPSNPLYLLQACRVSSPMTGDLCNYIVVNGNAPAGSILSATLYAPSSVSALSGGYKINAGATPLARKIVTVDATGTAVFRFGQATAGSGPGDNATVTAVYGYATAYFVFLELVPVAGQTGNVEGSVAAFSVATPKANGAEAKMAELSSRNDPAGRFTSWGTTFGMPGWLIAVIVIFSVLLLVLIIAAVWYTVAAKNRRAQMQRTTFTRGGGRATIRAGSTRFDDRFELLVRSVFVTAATAAASLAIAPGQSLQQR
eukprot:tig00020960_g16547.t1